MLSAINAAPVIYVIDKLLPVSKQLLRSSDLSLLCTKSFSLSEGAGYYGKNA